MEDRRWKQHELFYLENISAIISRVKYGTEKWIHRLWQKICLQYNTNKVEVIAEQMMTVMTGNNSSIIYHLFSFQAYELDSSHSIFLELQLLNLRIFSLEVLALN